MAQAANTFDSYDAVGNREELSDKIFMITPEKTPFLSFAGKETVVSTHPEWQTDTLATPDTGNKSIQGNEWDFEQVTPTTRVGNYTQISDKKIRITRTQEKTSKAGRKSELARELRKRGVELRIDMEAISLSNQASSAGSSSAAPTLGGLAAWLETNAFRGSGGSDGGFNSSTGVVDAATDGTQRAFTKTIMDDVIQSCADNGGDVSVIMLSNYAKRVFSTFMSDSNVAQQRFPASKKETTIVGAADMYVSDFGTLAVVPNVQMTRAGASVARNIFFLTPGMVKLGMFDPITMEKTAKTGDAEGRVLVTEYTLKCNNEAAHGVAADIYGLTSSS